MPEPNPENGSDPYEILGVTKMDSLGTIETQKDALIQEYQNKVKQAKRDKNNSAFKSANEALDAIEEAWEWMEENHTPPLVDEAVSLLLKTSDAVVASPVKVQVNGDHGPIADAKVTVNRDGISSERTDSSGEAQFTFDAAGKVQITVPTTDPYDDATATVAVQRQTVNLSFDEPPSSVEVNDPVEFIVIGDDGPEPQVTVTAGSTTIGRTDSNGQVSYTFSNTGSKTITATKSDDNTTSYNECTHTVIVSEETVQLSVRADGSDFEIGDDVVVEVTDSDGNIVEGAEVSIGGHKDTTNTNGRVRFSLDMRGSIPITATKSVSSSPKTYNKAKTQIQVSKRDGDLHINDVKGTLMEQNDITITVTDGTGEPLPEATVISNWGHNETTDNDGEATLSLDDYGDLRLTVTKDDDEVDYGEANRRLRVKEFTRTLDIDECPNTASPGDTINVRVTDSTGSPVANAEVRCDGQPGKTWTTDSDGRATVTFQNREGVRKIWVFKNGDGFTGAEADTNVHLL